MSDDTETVVEGTSYNPLQYSGFVNGDQFVIRGSTGAEMVEHAQSLAENMEEMQKAINAFKQIVIANGVFTGDSSKKGNGNSRAADSPPPSGDTPLCDKHGEPMKDLSGRGYRKRWYCAKSREEARGCLPKD